jgi:hypothetical protein
VDLTTDTGTDLCLMDTDQPAIDPSVCQFSSTAQDQLPLALAPLHAPQPREVACTETPTA